MTIYLTEIFLVFFLWQFRKYKLRSIWTKIDGKTFYLIVIFFIFGITMALRKYTVGTDTEVYYGMYKNIAHSSSFKQALNVSKIPSAIVYVGIHYCITRVIFYPQLCMVVNSLIIAVGFFKFIKRESTDYLLSSVLFIGLTFFYESMNGTRQFMAISLAINAFSILENDITNYKGWSLFILAVGIHNTILTFTLSFFGVFIAKQCKSIWLIHIVSVFLSALIALSFTLCVKIIIRIFPYYEMYVNGNNPFQIFSATGKGRIAILYLTLFVVITVASQLISYKNQNKMTLKAYHFGCIFCLVMGMIFPKNVLLNRILWPFLTLLVVYLPNLLSQYLNMMNRRILYVISICFPLAYSMIHLISDKSGIIPYLPFWVK